MRINRQLEEIEKRISYVEHSIKQLMCRLDYGHNYVYSSKLDCSESTGQWFDLFTCTYCGHKIMFDGHRKLAKKFQEIKTNAEI